MGAGEGTEALWPRCCTDSSAGSDLNNLINMARQLDQCDSSQGNTSAMDVCVALQHTVRGEPPKHDQEKTCIRRRTKTYMAVSYDVVCTLQTHGTGINTKLHSTSLNTICSTHFRFKNYILAHTIYTYTYCCRPVGTKHGAQHGPGVANRKKSQQWKPKPSPSGET